MERGREVGECREWRRGGKRWDGLERNTDRKVNIGVKKERSIKDKIRNYKITFKHNM